LNCRIRLMAKKDIPQVTAIDREAFPTMWPPVNFSHELSNRMAHYIVSTDGTKPANEAEPRPAIRLVPVRTFLGLKWPFNNKSSSEKEPTPEPIEYLTGFVGIWIMVDEAHIINIAVREVCRGKGIGELLLISSIDMATSLKATVVTLEVRASNSVAQNLYSKYGFNQVGLRKGYYTDNKEDAFIMTTDIITSESYRQKFKKLKESHLQRMKGCEYLIENKSQLSVAEPRRI
jgi:[ribosomal protein S18]-alanine N-acetyltransferase